MVKVDLTFWTKLNETGRRSSDNICNGNTNNDKTNSDERERDDQSEKTKKYF